jgi:hypothetical protein
MSMTQMYEVTIVATGEVRDADGNLVSAEPIEAKAVITEKQARALVEGQEQ